VVAGPTVEGKWRGSIAGECRRRPASILQISWPSAEGSTINAIHNKLQAFLKLLEFRIIGSTCIHPANLLAVGGETGVRSAATCGRHETAGLILRTEVVTAGSMRSIAY
jgi:hypothetical protein